MEQRTTPRPNVTSMRNFATIAACGVSVTLLAVLLEAVLWSSPGHDYGAPLRTGSDGSRDWTVQIRRDRRAIFSYSSDVFDATYGSTELSSASEVPSWSRAFTPATRRESRAYLRRYEEARGFPFLCLLASQTQTGGESIWRTEWGLDFGVSAKPNTPRWVFPVKPIWAGLILNTCFYSGIAIVLSSGVRRVHAAVRVRRGECRACGHPLAGSLRCPECGEG